MLADVVTGFEMLRGKLQRIGATLSAVVVLSACSGAAEEPQVADLEALDAATEEQTEPPTDVADSDDTEEAGDDEVADGPTEGTEQVDDATEPAAGDPYAIPEDGIDEEYVERVLNAILEVNREALTVTLASEVGGLVPFEAEERLRAIYGGAYGTSAYASLTEISQDSGRRELFHNPPGAVGVSVEELVQHDPDCLKVELRMDFSEVTRESASPRSEFLALSPKPGERVSSQYNPTPWIVVDGDMASAEGLDCP